VTASLRNWFARYRWSALFVAFCAAIATLGSTTITIVTNRLVAATTLDYGSDWAHYLVENIPEFPNLMNGETPSAESVIFLEQAKKSGKIFRFRLFDASGRLRIVSSELGKAFSYSTNLASEVPDFPARAAQQGRFAREMSGDGRNEPNQYALIYVPVLNGAKPVGWVEVAFDHSNRHGDIVGATTIMALVMGLLLALGPGLGFWYRTRQKQEVERTLSFMASHDSLTRLPNRDVLASQLAETLKEAARRDEQTALVHIEIARMQELTEHLDRRTMDALVLEIALRLKSEAGPLGIAARLSESSFALLKTNIHDAMDAALCAKSTLAALTKPYETTEHPLTIDVNIGLALAPTDGGTADELMKSAVIALLEARTAGRNSYRFFDASTESMLRRRRDLEAIVTEACEKKQFTLHYQPYFELATSKLLGFEALIRLTNPQYGSISPAEFIPVAENLGFIGEIGAWTLEQACKTAATWPEPLKVSVNLSPLQFRNGSIIVGIRKSLERARFPAYRLELEVTEGVLLDNIEYVQEQLRVLQETGVGIVLDDFGAGYSSLGYLWQFPFNKLKIDQSFIRAIDTKANVRSILGAIIGLGRSLSLPLTAEGIETPEQAEFLKSIGCTQAQGYHFGRPVPEIEVAGIIMRNYAESITLLAVASPPNERLLKIVS
jgi:diguanylate cyclase (GGDEF)-like protein